MAFDRILTCRKWVKSRAGAHVPGSRVRCSSKSGMRACFYCAHDRFAASAMSSGAHRRLCSSSETLKERVVARIRFSVPGSSMERAQANGTVRIVRVPTGPPAVRTAKSVSYRKHALDRRSDRATGRGAYAGSTSAPAWLLRVRSPLRASVANLPVRQFSASLFLPGILARRRMRASRSAWSAFLHQFASGLAFHWLSAQPFFPMYRPSQFARR